MPLNRRLISTTTKGGFEARVWNIQAKAWSKLVSGVCKGICLAALTHNHSCHMENQELDKINETLQIC